MSLWLMLMDGVNFIQITLKFIKFDMTPLELMILMVVASKLSRYK